MMFGCNSEKYMHKEAKIIDLREVLRKLVYRNVMLDCNNKKYIQKYTLNDHLNFNHAIGYFTI